MDDVVCRIICRLLKVPPRRRLDWKTSQIFEFYEQMCEDPGLQPEEFLRRFPNSRAHYPVVQMFAHALDRNRDDVQTNPARPAARLLGKKLGNDHYQILYRIGNGGMGEVYAARPANSLNRKRLLAIKTIYTKTYAGEERHPAAVERLRQRIVQEAHYLQRITNHDHVLQFIHAGYDPPPTDLIYIVTNFIEGRSLAELVDGRFLEPLPAAEILWLIREACKGLIAIHKAPLPHTVTHEEAGDEFGMVYSSGTLIHRDIKPSNILLDRGGTVKLIDLGLAGPAGTTILNGGTGGFIAPEQDPRNAAGRRRMELDERVDVYSLGKTFFSLLCRIPRPPDTLPDRADRIWHGHPAAYVDVILKASAQDPESRYANTTELLRALNHQELGAAARPHECRMRVHELLKDEDREVNIWVAEDLARRRDPGTPPVDPPRRPGHSRRWFVAAGGLGAASLVGLGVTWQRGRTPGADHTHRPTDGSGRLPPPSQDPRKTAPPKSDLVGSIEVILWHPGDPGRRRLSLKDTSALPLRQGDQIRIMAKVNRKAFLYIIWIDAGGKPQPVYPWVPGRWKLPAGGEQPVDRVELPESTGGEVQGWGLKSESGMETLLLLAGDTASALSVDFQQILADLPRPTPQHDRALVWFTKTGPVRVEEDPDRGPEFFNIQKIDDPLLQAQERIRTKLGKAFPLIEAVSFANQVK